MFMPSDSKTNIFLASFTTAHARLRLFSVLDRLGENEITPEDGHIVEFVSGGPKNYAYRTLSSREGCKVRGFTLNWANSKVINFEAIKSIICTSQ
jgi:hypothetical protein